MKQYEVLAPCLVFSIRDEKGPKEYLLKEGDVVDLPETNIAVKAMLFRGQICESKAAKLPKRNNINQ